MRRWYLGLALLTGCGIEAPNDLSPCPPYDAGDNEARAPDLDAGTDAIDPGAFYVAANAYQGPQPRTEGGAIIDGQCVASRFTYDPAGCFLQCGPLDLDDTQLCVHLCTAGDSGARNEIHEIGGKMTGLAAIYIPGQCAGRAVDCTCIAPDVCGSARCKAVVGNDVECTCP